MEQNYEEEMDLTPEPNDYSQYTIGYNMIEDEPVPDEESCFLREEQNECFDETVNENHQTTLFPEEQATVIEQQAFGQLAVGNLAMSKLASGKQGTVEQQVIREEEPIEAQGSVAELDSNSQEQLEATLKFKMQGSSMLSNLVNMSIKTSVEIQTKEQVLTKSLKLRIDLEKQLLEQLRYKKQELALCIENRKKVLSVIQSDSARLVKEKASTRTVVDMLKKKGKDLEEMYEKMKTEEDKLQREPMDQELLLEQQDDSKKIENLQESIKKLQDGLAEEDREYKKVEMKYLSNGKTISKKMETLQEENESLRKTLQSLDESNIHSEKHLEELQDKHKSLLKRAEDMANVSVITANERKKAKLDLEDKLKERRNTYEELNVRLELAKSKYENLTATQSTKEETMSMLRDQISSLESKNIALKSKLQDIGSNLEEMKNKHSKDRTNAMNNLKMKYEELRTVETDVCGIIAKKNSFIEILKSKNQEEKDLTEKMSSLTLAQKNENKKIAQLKESTEKHKAKLGALSSESEGIMQELESSRASFEEKSNELRSLREQYRKEITSQTETLLRAQRESQEKIDALENQNAAYKIECIKIRKEEEAKHDLKIEELKEQVEGSRQQLNTLKKELDILKTEEGLKRDFLKTLSDQHSEMSAFESLSQTLSQNSTQNREAIQNKNSIQNTSPNISQNQSHSQSHSQQQSQKRRHDLKQSLSQERHNLGQQIETRPVSILKSPGGKASNKKVSFQPKSLPSAVVKRSIWDSDSTDDSNFKKPEDLFLSSHFPESPPELEPVKDE